MILTSRRDGSGNSFLAPLMSSDDLTSSMVTTFYYHFPPGVTSCLLVASLPVTDPHRPRPTRRTLLGSSQLI